MMQNHGKICSALRIFRLTQEEFAPHHVVGEVLTVRPRSRVQKGGRSTLLQNPMRQPTNTNAKAHLVAPGPLVRCPVEKQDTPIPRQTGPIGLKNSAKVNSLALYSPTTFAPASASKCRAEEITERIRISLLASSSSFGNFIANTLAHLVVPKIDNFALFVEPTHPPRR